MNFTVYKSSAGSGKTFTLVKEYLSVVLKNPYEFKNILAITFTNKAAAEMKNRVLLSLELLSDFDNLNESKKAKIIDLYNALLAKGLKHDEIIQNSKITITNIIHNYNYFAIGTIDSFTHKIVKTFAFDLKLPLNFEVELEKLVLINQAVEILISKIGTDNELTNFMLKYANSFIEDEKKADVKKQLIKLSELLFEEDSPKYLNELKNLTLNDFEKIIDEVKTNKKLIENTISNYANDCIELIKSRNIDLNSFYKKNYGLGNYLLKLSTKNVILPNSNVITTLNDDLWYSKTTPQHEKQAIDSIKNLLKEKVRNLIDYLNENNKNYIIANAILGNIYSLSLLNEIEKIINQISHYDNVIHISEFSKSINSIVNNEPIPFIYERVGERYKNFLIDEFQDTSLLQWQNLLPLIENSLSVNNFNMIVGDGKQAIYRFRGGEVEQFTKLPEIYKKDEFNFAEERENSIKHNYKEENLNTNYRSKSNIIEFNNLFFDFAVKNLKNNLIENVYRNHSQVFKQTNTGGGVMIKYIDAENKNIYKQSTYEAVLRCIEIQIADGYQLKDITVLCRHNAQAYRIANYLNANAIDVISSESLLLVSSAEVRLMVALLKYINNKNDKINNANIIRLFLEIFGKDNSELNNFLIEYNKNPSYLDEFLKNYNLNLDFQLISGLSLYELCENIISQIFSNAAANPYLMFFLDTVYNFTTKYNSSTADFISFWEEKKSKLSLKVPSGINAVTIMTIHKSKGLEFPVVIYPFADSTTKNTQKNLWIKVDNIISEKLPYSLIPLNKKITETEYSGFYEEESQKSKLDLLNIIYVAFTRAAERLYIITSKVKEEFKKQRKYFYITGID
jgi:ATP-dependent exoDNAse (exonuclease V) beta subunit